MVHQARTASDHKHNDSLIFERPIMKSNALTETAQYGFDSFKFLVEHNTRITTREFVEKMLKYSDNDRTREVAKAFEGVDGLLQSASGGHRYMPEDDDNRSEIAVRNVGWTAQESEIDGERHVKLVESNPAADGTRNELPDVYRHPSQAYAAGVEALQLRLRATKPELPHDAHVEEVFDLMREVVEGPNGMLKHYKNDFYVHDKNALHAYAAQGKFVWVVAASSTQLAPIGINRAATGFAESAMNGGGGEPYKAYLIDGDRMSIKEVTRTQALDAMKEEDYKVVNYAVIYKNKRIAYVSTELKQMAPAQMPAGLVQIAVGQDVSLSVRDLIALREISLREVVTISGSLFTHTHAIYVGEGKTPINEMIDRARGFDEVSQSRSYGTIKAAEKDREILESLGVALGTYDAKRKLFPVSVATANVENLKPYAASFNVHLDLLPFAVKPDAAINAIISPDQMRPVERLAYAAYLNFAIDRNGHVNPQSAATTHEAMILKTEMNSLNSVQAAAEQSKAAARAEAKSAKEAGISAATASPA